MATILTAAIFSFFLGGGLGLLNGRRKESVLRAEIERRLRAEQGERAANLDKSNFLARMSHDLRTPLGIVLGTTDLLLAGSPDPTTREKLQDIETSAETLLTFIDDVFDFAKLETGRLRLDERDFCLRESLAKAHQLVAVQANEKGLQLRLSIDPETPDAVRGDPVRLVRVLLNLAGNAVKFTFKGEVEIRVEKLDDESDGATKAQLCFSVRDTGIGISQEDQQKIFQTFVRSDSSSAQRIGGSGLGLAIARELVELMGGDLCLKSERGEGSTFWFHLPFAPAREIPDGAAEHSRLIDGGGKRILVVDDLAANRTLARGHLLTLGLDPLEASDGGQALKILREAEDSGSEIAAMMIDCRMPELDGYETTLRLRRDEKRHGKRRLPVIAVTASAQPSEREKCLAAGMDDYLTKPYRGRDLAAVLSRWLEFSDPDFSQSPQDSSLTRSCLDIGRLEALRALDKTDEGIFTRSIREYLQQSGELATSLLEASEQGEAPRIEDHAHALAGISAAVGAARVVALSRELESRVARDRVAWADLLKELCAEHERATQALGDLLQDSLVLKSAVPVSKEAKPERNA